MGRKTKIILGVSLFLFSALVVAVLISWVVLSHDNYNRTIKPGEKYTVGEREYTLPKVNARSSTGSNKSGSKDTSVHILKDEFLQLQRDLLVRVTSMLKEFEIPYWISGGTLLGFMRHGTFIPWDDDMDLHVKWDQREYMYSKVFSKKIADYGLESIMLPGIGGYEFATKEGAAIRLRVIGSDLPVCDIFFEKQVMDEKDGEMWVKIDSWKGDTVVESSKERWPVDQLFPLQTRVIDDIELMLPANPQAMLEKQYSKSVMDEMVYRHPMLSHQFPFRFLFGVWKKRS